MNDRVIKKMLRGLLTEEYEKKADEFFEREMNKYRRQFDKIVDGTTTERINKTIFTIIEEGHDTKSVIYDVLEKNHIFGVNDFFYQASRTLSFQFDIRTPKDFWQIIEKYFENIKHRSEDFLELEGEINQKCPLVISAIEVLNRGLNPSDEEIESYSKGVQSRIKELTHARHDERRAKEAAMREKQELERLTQQILEENKKLKEYVKSGEATYQETLQAKAEAELEMARRKYKEAADSYDNDALLEAQEALTDAKMKLESAKNFRPTPLQSREVDVQIRSEQPQAPELDQKTLRWQAKNQWFGSPGYEEVTAFALGLHQKLVATGVDPRSDEYFDRVDGRLKQVFPEVFNDVKSADPVKAEPTKKPANVVAPATRSSGAKKVIKLTATQARLAEKYGLTHKQYAQEVLKLEAKNG